MAPIELALEQEKRVTAQINELTKIAREEADFASDQFMQWFIKEQVEEVSTMSDLLTVVRRARNDVEAIEDYILREHRGDARTRPRPRWPAPEEPIDLSVTPPERAARTRSTPARSSVYRIAGPCATRRNPGRRSGRVSASARWDSRSLARSKMPMVVCLSRSGIYRMRYRNAFSISGGRLAR